MNFPEEKARTSGRNEISSIFIFSSLVVKVQ